MYTCDHRRDQIWEDLFGLLEPGDSESLHRHVMACSGCRAEMERARAEHKLVAAAARLDVEIPPLTITSVEEAEPVFVPPRPQTAAASHGFRIGRWLAAAAVLLLILGVPIGFYQYSQHRYQAAWRAADNSLAEIVKQREELQSQAQAERHDLVRAAVASHLCLQVVGPADYQPGAVSPYRLWVSDVDGQPVDAPVTACWRDAGKSFVLDTKRATGKGQWLVDLPANLPLASASTPSLELLVSGQADAVPVQASLHVMEPAYRTRLTTDKPVYQAGETIHFRSLTLERFGFKIPDREFTAIYTMADGRGKDFQTLRGLTQKNGIGGGDFSLSSNWPAGEYSLTVSEAANLFPPATCRFRVGPAATGLRKAPSFDRLEFEFFPEGGDLVADVDNRVYFRVRTPLGQPADLQGAIVDSQGREAAAVKTVGRVGQAAWTAGLGMFTLRPRVGETYKLQVASPRAPTVHAPFPPTRTMGVSLSLPKAVAGPHEPFRAIIQHTGPDRNLIVGLFCQGRLVDQELVEAQAGITEVPLTPTISCSGIFRITVFEERQGQLWPLAERLAYRRQDKHLVLSAGADKENYSPGETVRLNLRTSNEQGKPEPAWVLVSVVNQAALSGDANGADTSLPGYFHLTSELPQPEELEQADILLSDSPQAAAALDRFLGTQGWRRFLEEGPDTKALLAKAGARRRAQDLAIPAIVKLDNRREVQRRYTASLNQSFAAWRDALTRRDHELATEGAERLQIARGAAQELDGFEERAGRLMVLAMGLGGVAVFALGCLLLGAALWRLVRGLNGNRGYLAGAFAALALCALILWRPAAGWGNTSHSINPAKIADYADKLQKQFVVAALVWPNNQSSSPSLALSQGAGPLYQEVSTAKHVAAVGSTRENGQQGPKPPSAPSNRQPWIGFIRAAPTPEAPATPAPANRAQLFALPLRVYAYEPARQSASSGAAPDTIYWQPILLTQNGTADLSFTLPAKAATYRILAQGHDAAGRLGTVQEKLECRSKR